MRKAILNFMPLNTNAHTHTLLHAYRCGGVVFATTFCQCFTLSVSIWLALTLYVHHSSNVYTKPHSRSHARTETRSYISLTLPMKNLWKFHISKVRCFNLEIYLWLFCNRDKKERERIPTHTDRI